VYKFPLDHGTVSSTIFTDTNELAKYTEKKRQLYKLHKHYHNTMNIITSL